jgi:DNA-directed RNA polymerase subunit RPC12/RpoP
VAVIVSRGGTKWWLDPRVLHECDACDTTFKLEPTDDVDISRGALVATVVTRCPNCGAKVLTPRPAITREPRPVA